MTGTRQAKLGKLFVNGELLTIDTMDRLMSFARDHKHGWSTWSIYPVEGNEAEGYCFCGHEEPAHRGGSCYACLTCECGDEDCPKPRHAFVRAE